MLTALIILEIVDETDIYVDVQQKIKVVRGPNKRAAGKALAPLIQGQSLRSMFNFDET